MTVAEKIKRSTKPLSFNRAMQADTQAVVRKTILSRFLYGIGVYEYQFIDGSKLTCRVYW